MISISHSPNSDWKQQVKALSFILLPWKWFSWRKGEMTALLENDFEKTYESPSFSFSAGREALYAILEASGVKEGDEVILQSYTCIVVPNAIIRTGATPVYVDIDHTLNIDPDLIEAAITEKTKALIIQHTFGVPAHIEKIKEVADRHSILLIEDCAHALGAKYQNRDVGTFGDAAIFSFGRDKIISSVSGGMLVVNNDSLINSVDSLYETALRRKRHWVFQNLMHPLLVPWMARLMGKLRIGQILLTIAQSLKLVNKVYTKKERCAEVRDQSLYQLPNAMASMARQQFAHLPKTLASRKSHAKQYQTYLQDSGIDFQGHYEQTDPAYLNVTILTNHKDELMDIAKGKGYLFGNWYNAPIMPEPNDLTRIRYTKGICPEAEHYTTRNVNLPTAKKFSKHIDPIMKLLK